MHSMSVIAVAEGARNGSVKERGGFVVACEERQLCDFLSESQGFDNLAIETNWNILKGSEGGGRLYI